MNRLFVLRERNLLLRFGQFYVRFQATGVENLLRRLRRKLPGPRRAGEQTGQLVAFKTQQSCQADAGKVGRPRHADGGIGRNQSGFRRADVGAPFKQRRRQSRRHGGRLFLLRQRTTARRLARVSAQQQADLVLSLLDQPLDVGDGLGRAINQLLGLAHIQHRGDAASLAHADQAQRFLTGRERPLRNLKLRVQFEQVEIGGRDVAHEGRNDGFAVLVRGEQIGARGFGSAAQPAPNVNLEREQIERDSPKGALRAGIAQSCQIGASREVRELI
ncbi:MAG: hypothetical protein JMDDDDMK_04810 [Acidobacteria bacterium]|nr:hypothetical protein [Acidobacteriota bacterium]